MESRKLDRQAQSHLQIDAKTAALQFFAALVGLGHAMQEKIDAARMNRDAGQISQEVVQHLVAILSANVEITIEVQATAPGGFPPNVVRTISENCRTLKFTQHDFTAE